MKQIVYFLALILAASGFSACAAKVSPQAPKVVINPAEMYYWLPPSEERLRQRRLRQERLDAMTAQVEQMFFAQVAILEKEEELLAALNQNNTKVDEMETALSKLVPARQKRLQKLGADITLLKSDIAGLHTEKNRFGPEVAGVKPVKPGVARAGSLQKSKRITQTTKQKRVRVTRPSKKKLGKRSRVRGSARSDYISGIRLFKNSQYRRSAEKFRRALSRNPAPELKDNIHFALAGAYYRMKQYPEAIRELNTIIESYASGDKWLVSHILLGLAYNYNGQKSQALSILVEVMKKNPPDHIRRMAIKVQHLIEEEATYVSS